MIGLIIKVASSWQLILTVVVLVLFFTLVSYVARPRSAFSLGSKPKKRKKAKAAAEGPEVSAGDELNLEE
ncbi:MAG: hypothetical protein LBQ44_00815 [Treponema sp.]|nr:hypothetical protein [Treponema sp.]